MRSGPRNQLVSFYRWVISSQNTFGEDVRALSLLGTAWVHIEALSGRELEIARQTWAEARFRITMNHPLSSFTLRRADVILWGSPARTLDILDAEDPTQQRREVVILAKELAE